MAQRVLTCADCLHMVDVPDAYLHARIQCPYCNAVLDRRSGAVWGSAAPVQPASRPQQTAQPRPMQQQPPAYPAPVYMAPASSEKKGVPKWVIGLIVGGVLLVAGLVAVGVWAVGLIQDAASGPDESEWVTYTAPDKHFTAKFPRDPTATNENVGNNIYVTFTICRTPNNHFEVSWAEMPRQISFDFVAAVNAIEQETGGKLTRQEPREFMGLPGRYGEIDDGRYKVLIFRSKERVWTIAVFNCPEKFDAFLGHVRLSDHELGVKPLTLEYQHAELYQGVEAASLIAGFVPKGGREPFRYKFTGELPPGLRHEAGNPVLRSNPKVGRGLPLPETMCLLVGSPGKAGKFALECTVTDADGREASAKAELIVSARPEPIGWITCSSLKPSSGGGGDAWQFQHGEYSVPVGVPFELVLAPDTKMVGYRLELDKVVATDLPDWLEMTHNAYTIKLAGIPGKAASSTFSLRAVLKLPGSELSNSVRQEITITVEPVSAGLIWDIGAQRAALKLTTVAGIAKPLEIRVNPARPRGWGTQRDWHLTGEWDISAAKLPRGVTLTEQTELAGLLPSLSLTGAPEETGTWEFDVKVTVTIDFVEEPIEVVQPVVIQVGPIPAKELPLFLVEAPGEWIVEATAGKKVGSMVPLDFKQPIGWNRARPWNLQVDWQLDKVELPDGLYFEEAPASGVPRLFIKGSSKVSGEWTIELKILVTLKYFADSYELVQPVKISIR